MGFWPSRQEGGSLPLVGKQRVYAPTGAPGVIEDGARGQVGRGTWEARLGGWIPVRQRRQELKILLAAWRGVGEVHSSFEAG